MREIDRLTTRDHQLSPNQLMLNAALACYEAIASYFPYALTGKKALILCGPGNNGGDGAGLPKPFPAPVLTLTWFSWTRWANAGCAALNAFQRVLGMAKKRQPGRPTDQTQGSLTFVECDSESAWESQHART